MEKTSVYFTSGKRFYHVFGSSFSKPTHTPSSPSRLKVYARSVASGMMSRMDTHHASLVGVIPDLVEDSWNLKCLEQLQDQESVLKDKHDQLNQELKHKVRD